MRVRANIVVCRLVLQPEPVAVQALEATFAMRDQLFAWLDRTVPREQSADLVALNRLYYEPARMRFGLPAQMTILALRDWMRRRRGECDGSVSLDDKLLSVRRLSLASISTVTGRHQVRFRMAGYLPAWRDSTTARLLRTIEGFEIHVASEATLPLEDQRMTTESIVGRIGRLIAGMAHGAVDTAERANPRAVMEHAIREIDSASEDVRTDVGRKLAERHRVEARRKELGGELAELDRKIGIAVTNQRDDLASAGIERQLDIESQIAVLDALLKDIDDGLAQLNATLDAMRASRREAESRLADLERSTVEASASGQAATVGSRAEARVERAEGAIARVTGVPNSLPAADPAVGDLKQLARDHEVRERLARLKSRVSVL